MIETLSFFPKTVIVQLKQTVDLPIPQGKSTLYHLTNSQIWPICEDRSLGHRIIPYRKLTESLSKIFSVWRKNATIKLQSFAKV